VYAERDAPTVEPETMPDHVHLPVTHRSAVRDPPAGHTQITARSSRLLRDEFPHLRSRLPARWTNSYFVATVGGATLEVVKRYVENQRNV
jgi:putative transposase